jgi:hypothetical protein
VKSAPDGRSLSAKLGISAGSRVGTVRPNPATLDLIRRECPGAEVVAGRVTADSDIILYWTRASEDASAQMAWLEKHIKPNGRIWVILPKKAVRHQRGWTVEWEDIQQAILKDTHLVDNKVASIDDEEYGTQYVVRKEWRETVRQAGLVE